MLFSSESSEVKRETDDLIEKQLQLDFDQIDEDFDDSEDDITMIQGYGASMDSQDENNEESSDVYEETITYTDSTPVSIIDVDDNLSPVEVSDSDIDFDLSDAIDSSEMVIRNYDSFISDFYDPYARLIHISVFRLWNRLTWNTVCGHRLWNQKISKRRSHRECLSANHQRI